MDGIAHDPAFIKSSESPYAISHNFYVSYTGYDVRKAVPLSEDTVYENYIFKQVSITNCADQ